MAINYDALPSSKPQSVLPSGYYMATIIKAEMKRSKSGSDYLNLQYDINNGKGVTGKLFDMQFDSEKEFLRYKLQRFLTALNLTLSGTFELKDLCKLVNGKKFVVDVSVEDNEQYGKRNTVNSFEHEIYYPINEWASLTAATAPVDLLDAVEDDIPTPTDADAPINAADALDTAEEY